MLVNCPFCNADYKIEPDELPCASGNDELGYGWKLKCHKCSHVWWLSKIDLVAQTEDPVASSSVEQINDKEELHGGFLSNLYNKFKNSRTYFNKTNSHNKKKRGINNDDKICDVKNSKDACSRDVAILIIIFVVCIMSFYFYRQRLSSIVYDKKMQLSNAMNAGLDVHDVTFCVKDLIDGGKAIHVVGKILNKSYISSQIERVEVVVSDGNEILHKWEYKQDHCVVVGKGNFEFSTSSVITNYPGDDSNISVDVNVICK